MAFKTYASLASTSTVLDADLFASYSGSGPLKSITAANVSAYLQGKTVSLAQTISINTATTAVDYLILKPTDYGVGKPALYFSKEATALNYQIQLYDGATVAGQIDLKLTLLNLTGTMTVSGALVVGGGLTLTGAFAISGLITYVGAPISTINTGGGATLDFSVSDYHQRSISTNTTYTIQGGTASKFSGLALELTIASGAVPTFTGVKWDSGLVPTLPNGRNLLVFIWNGTDVTGSLIAQAVA